MEKIRTTFQKFMIGRYGVDKLSNYLLYGGLAFVFLFSLLKWTPGNLIGWAAILIGYYRSFSRNRTKRYQENQQFLTFIYRLNDKWNKQRNKFHQRKVHKYYSCSNCHKEFRVPRNKGKIKVTCPHCKEQFIKKT